MNMAVKTCEKCGKIFDGYSWETKCWECANEERLEDIRERIINGEDNVDTWSDKYIICPYCGRETEAKNYYYMDSELLDDGLHGCECLDCKKTFLVNTTVSRSWQTEKMR